jgi:hypothetical protein
MLATVIEENYTKIVVWPNKFEGKKYVTHEGHA